MELTSFTQMLRQPTASCYRLVNVSQVEDSMLLERLSALR